MSIWLPINNRDLNSLSQIQKYCTTPVILKVGHSDSVTPESCNSQTILLMHKAVPWPSKNPFEGNKCTRWLILNTQTSKLRIWQAWIWNLNGFNRTYIEFATKSTTNKSLVPLDEECNTKSQCTKFIPDVYQNKFVSEQALGYLQTQGEHSPITENRQITLQNYINIWRHLKISLRTNLISWKNGKWVQTI